MEPSSSIYSILRLDSSDPEAQEVGASTGMGRDRGLFRVPTIPLWDNNIPAREPATKVATGACLRNGRSGSCQGAYANCPDRLRNLPPLRVGARTQPKKSPSDDLHHLAQAACEPGGPPPRSGRDLSVAPYSRIHQVTVWIIQRISLGSIELCKRDWIRFVNLATPEERSRSQRLDRHLGSGLKTGQELQQRGGVFLCDRGSSHQRYPEPICLLYTSDAADDLLCVDLGGRRIIKKK